MSSSSAIFSGNSRFATDFQSVIDRSVAIASLPLQELTNTKNELTDESTALSGLDTKFSALQSAIADLGKATGLSAFSAAADSGAVKAHISEGVREGSYTINVVSLGAQISTMSSDGLAAVSDPDAANISSASTFTLTVNGTNYSVSPTVQTLNGLVDAINALPGADVQATIVNVGSNSTPDYRLSITGTKYRADSITLSDGTQNLLTTLTSGANTQYQVNGSSKVVQNDSRNITLAPGLTLDLLDETTPGTPVTVSVTRNSDALQKSLSTFIDAYNGAVDEIDKQRGQNSGPLAGESILSSLSGTLRGIVTTSGGSGLVTTLTQLGVVLDQYGHLSLDTARFNDAVDTGVRDAFAFLGSLDGGGFEGTAYSLLQAVEDPLSGIIHQAINTVNSQITNQDSLIAENQNRIDLLKETLQQKMAAADALIASLEQQVNYFTGLFETMKANQQKGY